MQLKDLLVAEGIEQNSVLVLRHRPRGQEGKLRKALPWLAMSRPELFNEYQSAQTPKVEKAFQRSKYVASFIGVEAGSALFVGLYQVGKSRPLTKEQFWRIPANRELRDIYGMGGFEGGRPFILRFDLQQTDFYRSWSGRLTVNWPGLERSWWRWADRNIFAINSITKVSEFVPLVPRWDELILNWDELQNLPPTWRDALRHWRAIYFIHDTSDGYGYVGSAYGADNLLGRWIGYSKSGHGENVLLKKRDPKNFVFSILRLLNHDEDKDEVIRIESSWKSRLHTRHPRGLNKN